MSKRLTELIRYNIPMFLALLNISVFAQTGQVDIPRVQQMPNLPSPYLMRNWKEVAVQYDQFIISTANTVQYLPLLTIKPTGVNFPETSPILLQTYVGTNSVDQAEAINIIPSLVGASLMNIDKSNQNGINWVSKVNDFFNKANGQDVFLNGYSAQSGGDWWYDIMPNVYFYQLYSQYPNQTGFRDLLTTSADRWLEAVHAMGGKTTPWTVPQMNYRAWNLMTMTGNADGVKEQEAAGGIGWLLYHAYLTTGETKYLDGAQMSIEFLSNLTANPAYELQLPYGALVAAKMNAELGTSYDISKMVNWTFDRNPSRGWGAIAGTWNGADVDGLIGEANDTGNDYAFIMNGFQQSAALVPLVKYDKRFARGIAKWTLNLANASRLFYSKYLPQASQDDYLWSSTYDPQSVLAYEALKEKNTYNNNIPLYGTGDAKRNNWAKTNLSIYSSSSVGYMAAIAEASDVEGILILDVNKTDFFYQGNFPSYVIYNPYVSLKQVILNLTAGPYDIYDAISETVVATNVSNAVVLPVKADEAVLLVCIPAGSTRVVRNGKLYVGNEVIDYHYGYDFAGMLRIKSMAVSDTLVEFRQQVPVYVATENTTPGTVYKWYTNGNFISSSSTPVFTWSVPEQAGRNVLLLQIELDGKTARDSIVFKIVDNIPTPPVIQAIATNQRWYTIGNQAVITCDATDDDDLPAQLTYVWSVSAGTIIQNGSALTWQPPSLAGVYEATCKVSDRSSMSTSKKKMILVKPAATGTTAAFAYYPFDGDANDFSGNQRNATAVGVELVADARGEASKAYTFDSGSDIVYLANSAELNFQNEATLSFWINLESLPEESFVISHGSWEERWKVSITPDMHLRWTVKTNTATKDLDSSLPLVLHRFYHIAVVYSGYSMELYVDGKLDTFSTHSGLLQTTSKPLTIGRKDGSVTRYSLFGILDEVRIYNTTVLPDEINTLKETWNVPVVTAIEKNKTAIQVYPNPALSNFYIQGISQEEVVQVNIFETNGRAINFSMQQGGENLHVILQDRFSGLLIIEMKTRGGVVHKKILIK